MIHRYIRTNITATPFDNPHIRRIIDREIAHQNTIRERRIRILDPFARESFTTKNPQGVDTLTNDLNPDMPTDFHLEANDFAEQLLECGELFDLILWDPPYNLTQLKRQYAGIGKELELWQTLNPFGRAKDALVQCLRPQGSIVSLGFASRGFGELRGMSKMAIYNMDPSGTEYRYNIQCVVERKLQHNLMDVEA